MVIPAAELKVQARGEEQREREGVEREEQAAIPSLSDIYLARQWRRLHFCSQ